MFYIFNVKYREYGKNFLFNEKVIFLYYHNITYYFSITRCISDKILIHLYVNRTLEMLTHVFLMQMLLILLNLVKNY